MLELIIDNSPARTSEGWRARGRCRDLVGTLTPLFFSEDFYEIARAKAICSACPVLNECFDAAKSSHEPWGVWGGELFENGHVRKDKRPARPAAHAASVAVDCRGGAAASRPSPRLSPPLLRRVLRVDPVPPDGSLRRVCRPPPAGPAAMACSAPAGLVETACPAGLRLPEMGG